MGALLFNSLLYKSKIVPRLISLWGLGASALILTGSLLGFFGVLPLDSVMTFFGPPVAVGELALSFWLIAKGFSKELEK